jgi:hypothetical protein
MKIYSLVATVGLMTVYAVPVRADSYNISLVGGGSYNFVANELDFSTGNYVSNVLHSLPAEDSVLKFNAAKQQFYTAQPSDTLNPGEGAVIMHISSYPFFTFNGTQATSQPPLTLVPGQYQLVGRRSGGLGPSTYDDLVGAPPVEGATLLVWSPTVQDYVYFSYRGGQWNGPGGSSTAPQVPRGASALVVLQPALALTNGTGNEIILRWTAPTAWTLEKTTDLAGRWTTVTNASSPYTVQPAQDKEFYRLHGGLVPPDFISIFSR